ncbi:MAG: PD-(D/E)XK nuclease family protein, partial [Candidatus Dormibacteraceae bacterium]
DLRKLRALYKKRLSGVIVEDTWAFTRGWEQTRWDDWVGCWVRIKLDCAHRTSDDVLVVTDWKTGKFRPDQNEEYVEQLELYALAALILHPHLKEVRPRLAYLDTGDVYPPAGQELVFIQADVKRLKALWAKRTKAMLSDTVFAPKPNRFCAWCHFRKSNNGPCKF